MAYGSDWGAVVRIGLLVEGQTEKAFLPHLREYLAGKHLGARMPKLVSYPQNGRIPTRDKLKRMVDRLLNDGDRAVEHVIALTDIYTGDRPPIYKDASDAKSKMRQWVGPQTRFHPHVAQYDFEAWLIPYWTSIQKLAGHNLSAPSGEPEHLNHGNPPARRIAAIFETGKCGRSYSKTRDAHRILRDNGLDPAIAQCPELKSFVNTILTICDAPPIP